MSFFFQEFRDGRYGFSPLIARFCGDRMPKREIRAVSGTLYYGCIGNALYRKAIFKVFSGFVSDLTQCLNIKDSRQSSQLFPAKLDASTIMVSHSEENRPQKEDVLYSECLLEYLNGLDGFIRTKDLIANLPRNASGTLDCVWRLAVPSNFRIAFYIKEFALKAPNQCAHNFVEVYSGDTSDKPLRRWVTAVWRI